MHLLNVLELFLYNMKIYCKDCRKEIVGVVYVDDRVTRCEKCVEKFYKLEKKNEITSTRSVAVKRSMARTSL